ncbi:MAG: hypothetical protein LBH58_01115 [Tannerellaceae bacterium]|nr:hypothetical protein [Tannerellaceae bacterium]
MDQAEKIIDIHPDSTLYLLRLISNPNILDKKNYNKYYLLEIAAKDKCFYDISSDSIICYVKDYYIKNKDYKNAPLALFYCGRIQQENDNLKDALRFFLAAEEYAEHIMNDKLKGLIHSNKSLLYGSQYLNDKALQSARLANFYYKRSNSTKDEINSLMLIGNCHIYSNEIDSALYYYKMGIELADFKGYSQQKGRIMQNLSVIYRGLEMYSEAKQLLTEAINIVGEIDKPKIYISFANIYKSENKLDSALIYAEQSLNSDDLVSKRSSYLILADIKEKQDKFSEALEYYKKYNQHVTMIFDEEQSNAIRELSERYDFVSLISEKNKLIIEKQKILLISLLLIMVSCLISFLFYRKSLINKKIISEAEEKIENLITMANDYVKEEKTFKNILLHHFDILKKVAFIEQYISEDDKKKGERIIKKFNEVVYGKSSLNWEMLFETMNKLRNGFYEKIKSKYPELDESEYRICCLSCENFTSSEIAIIMNLSINTINKKKSIARKKIGVSPYGDLYTFFCSK